MARSFPSRPHLSQLRRQAKELRQAHRAGDPTACARLQMLPRLSGLTPAELDAYPLTLRETQYIVAREHGFESWAACKRHSTAADADVADDPSIHGLIHFEQQATALLAAHRAGDETVFDRLTTHLSRLADTYTPVADHPLSPREARHIIARENGFDSWHALEQSLNPSEVPPPIMTAGQVADFWAWASMADLGPLSASEEALVFAALLGSQPPAAEVGAPFSRRRREKAPPAPDIEQMDVLVQQEAGLLDSIGPYLIRLATRFNGCAEGLRYLLDRGVPLGIDPTRYNWLHEADTDALRVVFAAGVADATGIAAKVHTGWPDQVPMLFWPCIYANPDRLTLMLDYGGDQHMDLRMKHNGSMGHTVLQAAVACVLKRDAEGRLLHNARYAVVRMLIERGAYYDIFSASALDGVDRLEALLRADPDAIHATEEYQSTPLHWAARGGSVTCGTILLERGADTEAIDKAQSTPLHWAAKGQEAMIWLLAEHGADLDAQDAKGRTALHLATYLGQVESAEALIVLGASTRIKNRKGKTPLEVAQKGCRYLKSKPA